MKHVLDMAYVYLVEETLNSVALSVREYIGFWHQVIWIWYAKLLVFLWESQMLYIWGNRDLRGSKKFISPLWLEQEVNAGLGCVP